LEDVAFAHEKHPVESHLEEILWSDPVDGIKGTTFSPRGAGKLFGPDVTSRFLRLMRAELLIRGHEPSNEGYKLNHGGKVLTLFSRKGPPYYNVKGAFMQLSLEEKISDIKELIRRVHQF
ncbi:serine/threonine protein phosphatase, partial [Candidatus Bathyarchaeota archaeon]